LVENKMKIL